MRRYGVTSVIVLGVSLLIVGCVPTKPISPIDSQPDMPEGASSAGVASSQEAGSAVVGQPPRPEAAEAQGAPSEVGDAPLPPELPPPLAHEGEPPIPEAPPGDEAPPLAADKEQPPGSASSDEPPVSVGWGGDPAPEGDTLLLPVYASGELPAGMLKQWSLTVSGPDLCPDYGDAFSPANSPWWDELEGAYTYRVAIPAGYTSSEVRVEIFDPDTGNSPSGTHTIYGVDGTLDTASCSERRNPCMPDTPWSGGGENPNPYWYVNVDENRGTGTPGECGMPSSYIPAYNTRTLYRLYYYEEQPGGDLVEVDLAYYIGKSDDPTQPASPTGMYTGAEAAAEGEATNVQWVSPGASVGDRMPAYDGSGSYECVFLELFNLFGTPPTPDPDLCVPAEPETTVEDCEVYRAGYPAHTNALRCEGNGDFIVDLLSEVPDIFTGPGGERNLYLDVRPLSGASFNTFQLWAGPQQDAPADANGRNIFIAVATSEGGDNPRDPEGITVYGDGYLTRKSHDNYPIDMPLAYIPASDAGRTITVQVFDADAGSQDPIYFYFDSVSTSEWVVCYDDNGSSSYSTCDDLGFAREGPANIPTMGQWQDPPYTFSVPGLNDGITFSGGTLYVAYQPGGWDATTWRFEIEPLVLVVNTTDDGDDGTCDASHCSLREAINAANDTVSVKETIAFDIAGAGPHTIQPTSELPYISDPVIIDGTTEPDYSTMPVVEIDGTNAGEGAVGLHISAGNSMVRGLVINRFDGDGIHLTSDNNTIEGNYLGTDLSGTLVASNHSGIYFESASYNTIGGTTSQARNIISGNMRSGLSLMSDANHNVIQGNFIGTDVTGTSALGNGIQPVAHGIFICTDCHDNLIGGTSAGAGNLISGNHSSGLRIYGYDNTIQGNLIGTDVTGTLGLGNEGSGLYILYNQNVIGGATPAARNIISDNKNCGIDLSDSGASGTIIQGNYIGTDITGNNPLGNHYGAGINLSGDVTNVIIGGTSPGEGNRIAFNGGEGVTFWQTSDFALIQGNAIFSNNGLGIDRDVRYSEGVTPDYLGATLTSAVSNVTSITIQGNFAGTPSTTYRIELSDNTTCDPSGYGEGETYLGYTDVTTDESGDASFSVSFGDTIPVGHYITSTATDPDGNTSEFSACQIVAAPGVCDLQVTKEVDNPTPKEGETVTYTVTVTNNGPDDATGVSLTDVLPVGVTYVSHVPSQDSYDNVSGLWDIGDLDNGASATLEIVVTVDAGTGGSMIVNEADNLSAGPCMVDPESGNDSDSAYIVVKVEGASPPQVENVEVAIGGGGPYQLKLTIEGYHPDGCRGRIMVTQHRVGNNVFVDLSRRRQVSGVCSGSVMPFTLTVLLDGTFEGGETYTINVNGYEFDIDVPG